MEPTVIDPLSFLITDICNRRLLSFFCQSYKKFMKFINKEFRVFVLLCFGKFIHRDYLFFRIITVSVSSFSADAIFKWDLCNPQMKRIWVLSFLFSSFLVLALQPFSKLCEHTDLLQMNVLSVSVNQSWFLLLRSLMCNYKFASYSSSSFWFSLYTYMHQLRIPSGGMCFFILVTLA